MFSFFYLHLKSAGLFLLFSFLFFSCPHPLQCRENSMLLAIQYPCPPFPQDSCFYCFSFLSSDDRSLFQAFPPALVMTFTPLLLPSFFSPLIIGYARHINSSFPFLRPLLFPSTEEDFGSGVPGSPRSFSLLAKLDPFVFTSFNVSKADLFFFSGQGRLFLLSF